MGSNLERLQFWGIGVGIGDGGLLMKWIEVITGVDN